jgi:NADPH:quinone reductase-like Zn-dependent oxidoreductase
MRLIRFYEPGPPSVLQCMDVPMPEPKPGEVLIKANAIGVALCHRSQRHLGPNFPARLRRSDPA